jgi:alcohol dehydrogenase
LTSEHGPVADLRRELDSRVVAEFLEVAAGVPDSTVEELATLIRRVGADSVLAIGGGAAVDTAKAGAIHSASSASLSERAVRHVDADFIASDSVAELPLIFAFQMTLSGAEFTSGYSVNNLSENRKMNFSDVRSRATVVFQDTAMSCLAPRSVIAMSAFNAIAHCVEGIYSQRRNPMSTAIQLYALAELMRSVPLSYVSPDDEASRGSALAASALAALQFPNTGGGVAHSAAHAICGVCPQVPHGVAYAIALTGATTYNREVAADELSLCERYLEANSVPLERDDAQAALSATLRTMASRMGVPARLRDAGVRRCDLAAIAADTCHHYVVRDNPVAVTAEGARSLVETMW